MQVPACGDLYGKSSGEVVPKRLLLTLLNRREKLVIQDFIGVIVLEFYEILFVSGMENYLKIKSQIICNIVFSCFFVVICGDVL